MPSTETAEAADLHFVATLNCVDNTVEDAFHYSGCFLPMQRRDLGDFLYQFWMRTLEFAIWERAQTSALRHDLKSSLKRSLWPDASIQLRAAARPNHRRVLLLLKTVCQCWKSRSMIGRSSMRREFPSYRSSETRIQPRNRGAPAAATMAAQPPAAESKRPATGTASGVTTKDDAMLTLSGLSNREFQSSHPVSRSGRISPEKTSSFVSSAPFFRRIVALAVE